MNVKPTIGGTYTVQIGAASARNRTRNFPHIRGNRLAHAAAHEWYNNYRDRVTWEHYPIRPLSGIALFAHYGI